MTIPANNPTVAFGSAKADLGLVLGNGATLLALVVLSLVVFILGHGAGVT